MTSRRRDPLPAGREFDPHDARAARLTAMDALARRDHASPELRRKLLDKGFDPATVVEVIDRLVADRLVDDRRFVDGFIDFHAARGQGPRRIRADLSRLGLQGGDVEASLAAFEDWLAVLRAAREKKFGSRLPTHYADRQRQARFLSYRGFTGAQIRMALGFDMDLDEDS